MGSSLFNFLHPSPASNAFAIAPSDSLVFVNNTRGIYVGAAGNLTVTMAQDSASVTFNSVPAGSLLPIAVQQVWATGTTAGNLVGVY